MDATQLFKNLSLDTWYKALIYVGGAVFVASLFVDVKGLTNSQLQLLSGGALLLGLGEWKKHKEHSWIKPPNAYTGPAAIVTQTIRSRDSVGTLFDVVGVALILFSVFRILRAFLFHH
jgi:hypothetical protein